MKQSEATAAGSSPLAFLAGNGEMARLIRAFDWSRTPLGPPQRWPDNLKTSVRIMLTSRQPFWIGWGEELTYLYNDAYLSIIGGKHPHVLGQPTELVWQEIWNDIQPLLSTALRGDQGTYVEEQLLIMERNGYAEETYYTFSYSPIPDGRGSAGGIICANTDDTQRVIGERQLALLRELAAIAGDARTWWEAGERSARALGANRRDLPFALIYVADPEAESVALAAASGIEPGHPAAPLHVKVDASTLWPFAAVLRGDEPCVVRDLDALQDAGLPSGAWNRSPTRAAVLPIHATGQTRKTGVLVVGLNPFRLFDDTYCGFLGLVAGQIAANLGNAQAYEEERKRAEALAELDRAKTTFFSNVSHEFRTPLTLMLGPVEDMLASGDGDLSAAARSHLDLVHRNGMRLLRLVNTLLDFSRLEAGRVRAQYEPTELGTFTAELASVFRSACDRAGLVLKVECAALSEHVFVDRTMWEKIVLNLLSNAFKFTFDGTITVSLRQAGHDVELRVEDTGVGIPHDEIRHLFERFHRVENVRGRTHEGSGIGLALVQELVRLHGGSVSVESTLGEGTRFTVRIPRGSAHLPSDQVGSIGSSMMPANTAVPYVEEALRWLPEEANATDDDAPLRDDTLLRGRSEPEEPKHRPRVLIADDDADMRRYLVRLLADRYDVATATDGEAALEAVRKRLPDLVLTDVMMPRLDGFELLRRLRSDPRARSLPVIMLSARAGEESRVEGMDASADDYLVKPFGARELLARVGAHLKIAQLRRETDRRKDEFLATLAHELRNPLSPLRSGLQVLKLAKQDDALVEQTRAMMERQLGQMVRLIDDLLDVGRINRGKVTLRKERIDIVAVVEETVEAARTMYASLGQQLSVTVPGEAILLDADPTRLAQIIGNLLNNASKFTPRDGRVHLVVQRDAEQVLVRVRDEGIGIAADQLPRIFEMFAQIEALPEHSQGGLGIGLSLVKELAELHGGSVEAHSAGLGQGSEFILRLPLPEETIKRARNGTSNRTRKGLARRRILVVDDNRDAADSLMMLLQLGGHEAEAAYDGPEAIEKMAVLGPDVVVLDIGLPGMNGYEVARRIRQEHGGKDVLLIALTGLGQEKDRQLSKEAGFDAHLVKPVEASALNALITDSSLLIT